VSTSGIAQFLHVGRQTVQDALLEYGIAQPLSNPFPVPEGEKEILQEDSLLDPNIPLPVHIPELHIKHSVICFKLQCYSSPCGLLYAGPVSNVRLVTVRS
jgi:hypothetical protein